MVIGLLVYADVWLLVYVDLLLGAACTLFVFPAFSVQCTCPNCVDPEIACQTSHSS